MAEERYFCPRCGERTLTRRRVRVAFGEECDFLICEKCLFAVTADVLNIKTRCITPQDIAKLPLDLQNRARQLMRQGRLRWIKKFDIVQGQWHMCLEPGRITDSEALEVLRVIEASLT